MGSAGEATDQDMLAPDGSPRAPKDFLDKVSLNLALAWLIPIAVVRLHIGTCRCYRGSTFIGDPTIRLKSL